MKIRQAQTHKEWRDKKFIEEPWRRTFLNVRNRCNGYKYRKPNRSLKYYEGVRFKMCLDDFKYLWYRDNANEMKWATIHRINPDHDYTLENCEYVEHDKHSGLSRQKRNGVFKKCILCHKETYFRPSHKDRVKCPACASLGDKYHKRGA